MTEMTKYVWNYLRTLASGHRIFQDARYPNDTSAYAVADESGRVPERTDCGVLWLNHQRPIMLSVADAAVPVLDDDGVPFGNIIVQVEDVIALVKLHPTWKIAVAGKVRTLLNVLQYAGENITPFESARSPITKEV